MKGLKYFIWYNIMHNRGSLPSGLDIIRTYGTPSPESSPETSLELFQDSNNQVVQSFASRRRTFNWVKLVKQYFIQFAILALLAEFVKRANSSIFSAGLQGDAMENCASELYNLQKIDNHSDALNYCSNAHYDFSFLYDYFPDWQIPNGGHLTLQEIHELVERIPILGNISNIIFNTIFLKTAFTNGYTRVVTQYVAAHTVFTNPSQASFEQINSTIGSFIILGIVFNLITIIHHFTSITIGNTKMFVRYLFPGRSTRRQHGGLLAPKSLKNSSRKKKSMKLPVFEIKIHNLFPKLSKENMNKIKKESIAKIGDFLKEYKMAVKSSNEQEFLINKKVFLSNEINIDLKDILKSSQIRSSKMSKRISKKKWSRSHLQNNLVMART